MQSVTDAMRSAMLAAGVRRRRSPNTQSTNVCFSCRKSKLRCDGEKPCRRCVKRGCPASCVPWREMTAAEREARSEGQDGAEKRPIASEPADADATRKRPRTGEVSNYEVSRNETRLGAEPAPSWVPAALPVGRDFEDELLADSLYDASSYSDMSTDIDDSASCASFKWSDDDADDFSRDLRYLRTMPLPDDLHIPVLAA